MRWCSVFLLAGCNQLLDLRATRVFDAGQYDAPIDAPFSCPRLGKGPPSFAPLAHQAVAQACSEYTISASGNRAVALCYDPNDGSNLDVFEQTPGDTQLVRAAGIARHPGNSFVDHPELSPDGTTVWVGYTDYGSSGQTRSYSSFTRQADGSWSHAMDLTLAGDERMSSLAPTATGYRFVLADNPDQTFIEGTVDGAGAPVLGGPVAMSTIGLTEMAAVTLTPDGQRLLVAGRTAGGSDGTFYTDRSDLQFAMVAPVSGVPAAAQDPFLTPDCARVYYSASSTIVYVQQ